MDMNRVECENRLAEILSNEKMVEKIKEAKSLENLQAVLNEGGLALSLDETEMILAGVQNAMNQPLDDELTDEELENVNGGGLGSFVGLFAGVSALSGFFAGVNNSKYNAPKVPGLDICYWAGYHLGRYVKRRVLCG